MSPKMKQICIDLLAVLLAFIAPIQPLLAAVGALILVDLVTGLLASRHRGEPITSAALRRTISKLVIYNIAIISAFILERYLITDMVPVSKIAGSLIGVTEFKSIVENLSILQGAPLLTDLVKRLGSDNDTTPPTP